MKRSLTMVCAVFLAALPAPGARAQAAGDTPARIEARTRFTLAEQHFAAGDYASALREWEAIYRLLDGHPRRAYVTYNIARAHEELGRTREALRLFRQYLATTSEEAPNRGDAQRRVQELATRLSLGEDGAGERGFQPSPVGIAIASVGAAALIAGGVLGGLALARDGDARGDCEASRCTPEAYAELGDAHVMANAADGLLWGGLAVLATGVVLVFVLGSSSDASASAACTSEGCVAFFSGRL